MHWRVVSLLVLFTAAFAGALPGEPSEPRYGANPAVGRTFVHDGVTLYYEVYGTGEPLLVVHGNGGSIWDMAAQIEHFRRSHRVIAMDSRDHGKSSDSPEPLTYEKMTDDLAALIDHLGVGPVSVLGWSDGGIEALLLGIRHPAKVRKLVAMAANLNPSAEALHPEILAYTEKQLAEMPAAERETAHGKRERKVTAMLLEEPHIPLQQLETIQAPTLVIAGDHDMIRDEHTLAIFHHIPNSQLAILPNATHLVPFDDPAAFNAVVERFLAKPFAKLDRVGDAVRSLERMRAPVAEPK
jgi:pimeloyl-ACP methyl ester carboxylesterase